MSLNRESVFAMMALPLKALITLRYRQPSYW